MGRSRRVSSTPSGVVVRNGVVAATLLKGVQKVGRVSSQGKQKRLERWLEGTPAVSRTLLDMPPEVMGLILPYLPPVSFAHLSGTCRHLHHLMKDEVFWEALLKRYIPSEDFPPRSEDCLSLRQLYVSHHPYWFLPRSKLWFMPQQHGTGIMACKFDHSARTIVGHNLITRSIPTETHSCSSVTDGIQIPTSSATFFAYPGGSAFTLTYNADLNTRERWGEGQIELPQGRHDRFTTALIFVRGEEQGIGPRAHFPLITEPWSTPQPVVGGLRYPVRGQVADNHHFSETTFQIAKEARLFDGHWSHLHNEFHTWTTIDPAIYTPTTQKPYQGLFQGGSPHEILLVMQLHSSLAGSHAVADRGDDRDSSGWDVREDKVVGSTSSLAGCDLVGAGKYRTIVAMVISSRCAGMKFGDYSFVAPDIGKKGVLRHSEDWAAHHAQVVRTRGRSSLPSCKFDTDDLITTDTSELTLIDCNNFVHYWAGQNRAEFFQRLDLSLKNVWEKKLC